MPASNPHSIFILPCTPPFEIISIVKNMSNSKGFGLDGFSTAVIKSVIPHIANPLSDIFIHSFQAGIFPDILKHAKVTPVFKSDDKLVVKNYIPISVLPVFSKILEKLMCNRLASFLVEKHNLIYEPVWL